MSVRVQFDFKAVKRKIEKAVGVGQIAMATQALKDANFYVKKDTGVLEASSIKSSKLKDGVLVWNTPYARRQYYTGRPSKDVNPSASKMWAEVARRNHGKDWKRILQKAINRGV